MKLYNVNVSGEQIKKSGKTALTLLLFIGLVWWVGPDQIVNTIRSAKSHLILAAIGTVFFGVIISAGRWTLLLQAKNEQVLFREVFPVYYYGTFSNLALPSSYGGDVVKAHLMGKNTKNTVNAYSTIFINRIIGLITLISMAVISSIVLILINDDLVPYFVYHIVLFLFLLTILGLIMVFSSTIQDWITNIILNSKAFSKIPYNISNKTESFYNSLRAFRSNTTTVILVFLLSYLFNFVSIPTIYTISSSLGLQISIWYLFITIPLIQVILVVPVTINGYGFREGLYVLFYTPAGISSSEAVGFSITVSVITFMTYILGAGFILFIDR